MTQTPSASDAFTTFGEMLKHLRKRARLTQRDLGITVGYSETYITRLEGGTRHPDPGAVKALLIDALGLSDEPELARRLIQLAEVAHEKSQDSSTDLIPPTRRASPICPPRSHRSLTVSTNWPQCVDGCCARMCGCSRWSARPASARPA